MKREKIYPIIIYFMIFISSLMSRTITVDDDGGADYIYLEEAVSVASAGDTILVYEGDYFSGTLDITKPLVILGSGQSNTKIIGIDGVIIIESEGVKIDGFTLHVQYKQVKAEVLTITNCSPIITNNTFTFSDGSSLFAIECYGESSPEIHYNNFSNKGVAIKVNGSNDVDAENNWWGTADENRIQELIDDGNDRSNVGMVKWRNRLTKPSVMSS